MDEVTFDRLTRAVSRAGSRRQVLGVLASVGLGGLLSQLADETSEAKRQHGRNRGHHPGKGKDNRKGKRKGGKGGGGLGGTQCGAAGSDCDQDSDCCSTNCFNFSCSAKAHSCGTDTNPTPCRPPAKGCAGAQCCYAAVSCDDGCCQPPANQCNPQGNCCAPNCAGKQCGDDGCGAGGSCGACPSGQTCTASGTCQSHCTPQCQGKQCGDDGCGGSCGTCGSGQTCSNGACCTPQCSGKTCGDDGCGGQCGNCPADRFCANDICCNLNVVTDNACSATMPCCGTHQCRNGGCCFADGTGPCYTGADDACCSKCIPEDPNCTGRCPGTCSSTG